MSNNLVLAAAIGYKFEQIEFFVKSLRKFYNDKIVFLISDKDEDLKNKFIEFDCETLITKINKKEIQFKRYSIFFDYLKNKEIENILLCDSRDIYFQSNPFDLKYKGLINFFLEDKKIKDCPYNSNWILKTYGEDSYKNINENIILCSGTVLGNKEKIMEYLDLITRYISRYKYKKKLKYLITFRPDPEGRGCDQAHANYLIHNSKIKNFELYSNSKGPVATVFYLKKIIFDKNSFLINEDGKPYKIVHQYDKRWNEFKESVEKFKTFLNI